MISFSNPYPPLIAVMLVLVTTAAVLLQRLFLPSLRFPSFPWIARARKRSPLQNLLLPPLDLAFALGALLLLGVLFGRPVAGGKRAAFRAVVILIDGSLSMASGNGRTAFTASKQKASNLLKQLQGGDRANLAVCGAEPLWAYSDAPLGTDLKPLWRLLENAQPDCTTGSVQAGIESAIERLASIQAEEKQLYVISDFQQSDALRKVPTVPRGIDVIPIACENALTENVSIHPVAESAWTAFVREPVNVRLALSNASAASRTVELTWSINGEATGRESLDVPAQTPAAVEKRFSFTQSGLYEGKVEVKPADTLTQDNIVYFLICVRGRASVAFSADKKQTAERIQAAFGPAENGRVTARPLHSVPLRNCDVVIADRTHDTLLEEAKRYRIPRVLFLPASLNALRRRSASASEERGAFQLERTFRGSSKSGIPALENCLFTTRITAASLTGREIRARFTDQRPAVLIDRRERVVLALFPLSEGRSALLENAEAAVPLMGELMRLADATRFPLLHCGETASWYTPQRSFRFFAPDGDEIFPDAKKLGGLMTEILLPRITEAGFLRIHTDGIITASVPILPPEQESTPGTDTQLFTALKNSAKEVEAPRREITPWVLAALLTLSLLWMLHAAGRRAA